MEPNSVPSKTLRAPTMASTGMDMYGSCRCKHLKCAELADIRIQKNQQTTVAASKEINRN